MNKMLQLRNMEFGATMRRELEECSVLEHSKAFEFGTGSLSITGANGVTLRSPTLAAQVWRRIEVAASANRTCRSQGLPFTVRR